MKKISGSTRLVVVALLLVATLLAACGDNTPAPATTAAATTAAATTAAPTTAAATTVAATTAAPTTVAATTAAATTAAPATTAAATSAAAGTTAASSGSTAAACATCPQSYTEITLPQGLTDAAKKGLPTSVTNFTIQAFTTDDPADKVATDVDASTVANGYAFALPGATKMVKVGNTYSGGYSKSGSPDALVQVVDTAGLDEFLKATGADTASQQAFTQAVGSKKTVVFVFGGTGLLSASLAGSGNATAAATTAASGSTSGSTTTAASGTATADIPVYPGAVLVTLPEALTSQFASSLGSNIKNGKLEAYKVTDSDTQVKEYFTGKFTSGGWIDASSQVPASSTATLTSAGVMFAGPYVHTPQIAMVLIMKGTLFAGQAGVSASDTVYMVISGNV